MALRLTLALAGICGCSSISPALRSHAAKSVVAAAAKSVAAAAIDMSNSDKTKLWYFSDAVVNCKGQVFDQNKTTGEWQNSKVFYNGCGHHRGSCKEEKWSRGPYLQGPPKCTSPLNEAMLSECSTPSVPKLVVITQPQWGAYYHFLVDSLPRIIWVREQRPDLLTDPSTFFHVGMGSDETAQSWARMVGIDTELEPVPTPAAAPGGIVLAKKKKRNAGLEKMRAIHMSVEEFTKSKVGSKNRLLEGWWAAKQVIWPPSNGCVVGVEHADPHAISAMRNLVGQASMQVAPPRALLAGRPPAPMALLVQRSVQTTFGRALTNHDELLKALQETLPSGWTVEVFPDPSPDARTTCNMFHRADLIIGPHGAGFSNLMCSKENVPLIEIQQKPHAKDFQMLSGRLGMPYFGIPTEMSHGKPYAVDIPTVLASVKEAVSLRPGASAA